LNATSESLQETFLATAPAVPAARRVVAGFAAAAGFADEALDSVRLAVSEAVANVVRHAYPGGVGEIELLAGIASGELWVLIADRGCGFQTRTRNPGLGYGLAVIAEASKAFVIAERSGGGTEVQLYFPIPALAGPLD
jgi:anti-sigma regulatory factor (Ser/Thr protein kinase)